jgi:ribosomal protein L37AE/L43A
MAWFVGWILIFFSTSDSLQNSFYERRIKEYKESYGNELAVLKNNLSKARGEGPQQLQQPLCPTCREPLSYIQQYQYWYCYKCQKYTCPRTKTGETAP